MKQTFTPRNNRRVTYTHSYQPSYSSGVRRYVPAPTSLTRRRHVRHVTWLLGASLLICFALASVHFLPLAFARQKAISPVLDTTLAKNLTAIITQHNNDHIGVALEDISSGTTQTFGTTTPFVAASTSKVLVACSYYHLVETGQAKLNDVLGSYTAQFQLKEMINDSSNDSWHLLTAAIGDDQLQSYAQSIGINYDETTNSLTPQAMATLLAKLYKGELLNKSNAAQLLSYMQNTNDEELIPAALPQDITVYHKYGELDGELHDASIIVKNGRAYAFVIYTQKSAHDTRPDNRISLIHQLTQMTVASLF